MKIFNWVHRKFYQKDGMLSRNVNNDEINNSNEIIGDAQTLLQDASLAHMFLTIGTFGFDPLKDHVQDQNGLEIELQESLVENSSLEIDDDQECDEISVTDHDQQENEELYPLIYANNNGHYDMIEGPKLPNEIIIESNNSENLKKERITLADLFSADSDHHHHGQNVKANDLADDDEEFYPKKPASYSQVKGRKSFAKKLIPRVKEDVRSIKKLQKLMTRVLKRKVHPDIETKSGNKNNNSSSSSHQVKSAAVSMLGVSCVKHVRVNSISLHQVDQGVTA